MNIKENFSLKEHSFMQIGGIGAFLIEIENEKDLISAISFAKEKQLPIQILGSGSNSIFSEDGHKKVFIKYVNTDVFKIYEDEHFVNIQADAGLDWDELVEWTVDKKFSGLEALSLIPGTVGASPVQNIGAYGQEVGNLITSVNAYDLISENFYDISCNDCDFSYRNSLFKKNPNRFIINKVSFRLKKIDEKKGIFPEIPKYKDVQLYFIDKNKKQITLKEIREAIIEIRKNKIPDPKEFPNCGSFFENPIIDRFTLSKILMKYPEMPFFDLNLQSNNSDSQNLIPEKKYKIYAGWLLENSGLKGYDFGKIKMDGKNSLILINHNNANFKDLISVIDEIKNIIKDKFNTELVVEPNINF